MSLDVCKCSKKHIKFLVELHLEELSSVPFLSGVIFAKLRLLNGGNFLELSNREDIVDNSVCWGSRFDFECKLTASIYTGILESCVCRVSVRRELEGGRSYQKLGFANINLAEFASGTTQSRSYLLEKYSSSTRANNALLRVTIHMRVKEGDICFQVPIPARPTYFTEAFPLPDEKTVLPEPQTPTESSSQGKLSRKSSSSASESWCFQQQTRIISSFPTTPTQLDRENSCSSRIKSSRVDAESVIEQLLRESKLESSPCEGGHLALHIGRDGSAAVIGD